MSSKIPIATLLQELDPQQFIAKSNKKKIVRDIQIKKKNTEKNQLEKKNIYQSLVNKNGSIVSKNSVNKPITQFELIKQQLQEENLPIILNTNYDLLGVSNDTSRYRSRQRLHYRYLTSLLNRL